MHFDGSPVDMYYFAGFSALTEYTIPVIFDFLIS
jgi:hypothetical protein